MAVAKIVFLCSEVTAVSTYFIKPIYERLGFSGGSDGKKSTCNERDLGLIPGLGKIPWRRAWQPTPVFLPGESPWTEEPGGLQSMGPQSRTRLSNQAQHRIRKPIETERRLAIIYVWTGRLEG